MTSWSPCLQLGRRGAWQARGPQALPRSTGGQLVSNRGPGVSSAPVRDLSLSLPPAVSCPWRLPSL